MAEKTCASSSQESLPLSQETCKLLLENLGDSFSALMNDTSFQVGTDINLDEVSKEVKTLGEKLNELSQALAEEVAKTNYLSKLNAEMKAEIITLNKGREEQLHIEMRLKEQLQKCEDELQRTRVICYEEAAAKVQALQKMQEMERRSFCINNRDSNISAVAQFQSQLNEEDDWDTLGKLPSMEEIEDLISQPFPTDHVTNAVSKTPSSLPATESWPGEYNFRVSFPTRENVKAQWVYSALKNKLYVKKDAPCPISFSTSVLLNDFSIRTTAFFSSAKDILDPVHRCVNHSMVEIQNGRPEAEHLVRVDSFNAHYETDPNTRRHSVVVPFDNPAAGQQFSSYIYKFACFQSCSGGPNRRPLMLCFTLERRGIIVGRQKVHLKICACPLRDFKIDESSSENSSEKETQVKRVKREREEEPCDTPQKRNSVPNGDLPEVKIRPGPYYLKVDDRKNYEILKFFAKVILKPSNLPLHRNSLINIIRSSYSSSEDEDKK